MVYPKKLVDLKVDNGGGGIMIRNRICKRSSRGEIHTPYISLYYIYTYFFFLVLRRLQKMGKIKLKKKNNSSRD